jgi:hypothetical protein
MRKKILVLLSLAFALSANLRAQVTFGGLTPPVPGAILDLNSTNKGGLILSNVALTDLSAIPSSFPKVSDQDAALKYGMKGALIYNTNENTCIGIHTWNGDYWERIAANFVVAQGAPLSSSNAAIAFGGDIVNFTASLPGAKSYRWYVSENDGDYEYLEITTTNTWSKDFPTGKWKVKVIMDDCHSLTESNEFAFAPTSISPNFGSLNGGNTIYLYGDFPYASTDEYVQNGLVAYFDGINNTGEGDKFHSNSAVEWPNIKDMNFFLSKVGTGGYWTQIGFKFNNNVYFQKGTLNGLDNLPSYIPNGNNPHTVEAIFTSPASSEEKNCGNFNDFVSYGGTGYRKSIYIGQRYNNNNPCTIDLSLFVAYYGSNGYEIYFDNLPSLDMPNSLHSVQTTYDGTSVKNARTYIDGSQQTPSRPAYGNEPLLLTREVMSFGGWVNSSPVNSTTNYNLHSVRIYDHALEEHEIAKNAALDQIRYLLPPTVTIDNKNCTEVVVLSPHFLMCKVPDGNSLGTKEVKVNGVSYGKVYEYVDPVSDFYVSGISPIVGPANIGNRTLTLTGNLLKTITEVKVDNIVCTNLVTDNSTATCILPSHPAGEVDITITADSETYRFVKVFEYQ